VRKVFAHASRLAQRAEQWGYMRFWLARSQHGGIAIARRRVMGQAVAGRTKAILVVRRHQAGRTMRRWYRPNSSAVPTSLPGTDRSGHWPRGRVGERSSRRRWLGRDSGGGRPVSGIGGTVAVFSWDQCAPDQRVQPFPRRAQTCRSGCWFLARFSGTSCRDAWVGPLPSPVRSHRRC